MRFSTTAFRTFVLLVAIFMLQICSAPDIVLAQTNSTQVPTVANSQSPLLSFFISAIGLSAIVSGLVSAIVNYFFSLKELKKKRGARFIEDRLALYSFIVFQLDKMRIAGDAIREAAGKPMNKADYVFTPSSLAETVAGIDARLETRFYLVSYDIMKEWIFVKTIPHSSSVVPHIRKLRELAVEEYNTVITPEYQKIIGEEVPMKPSGDG
jgi:hypothetical protein